MKERFETRLLKGAIRLTLSNKNKWSKDKATLCNEIISVIEDYQRQGYKLSLRQLYYQLVSSDMIPNDDVVYKKLSGVLDDLRYSGKVDWDAIEDRGRQPYLPYYADGIVDALNTIINAFRLDRQKGQPKMIEVWTEKDAISGILRRITAYYHVQLVVNKGYSSSSAMHEAYERFSQAIAAGQKVKILYFGDHDPSGLDMVRDIKERLLFFLSRGALQSNSDFYETYVQKWWDDNQYDIFDVLNSAFGSDKLEQLYQSAINNGEGHDFDDEFESARLSMFLSETEMFNIEPIGLTREQIKEFNPPENPAKITDPRAAWYLKEHGNKSWEVDALPPDVMTNIVREHIFANMDADIYDRVISEENRQSAIIKEFADKYSDENPDDEQ